MLGKRLQHRYYGNKNKLTEWKYEANFYFYEIVSTQNYQNLKYLASKATLKINSTSKKAFLAARQHKIILN